MVKLWWFKVSLCFWQILGQTLCSFTQKVAKGLWNLVWGEHFHILMNFSNLLAVFIAEWHVHVYVSSTFPHSEQLDFSLKKCLVFHLLCQSLDFFPWKAVQLWAYLDKTLVLGFLTKYLWGLFPGAGTGAGQGSSKPVRIFLVPVQAVLHTLYWRSLFYLFPLLFILVGWNLIFIVWNSTNCCSLTTVCVHLNFF